MSKLRVMIVDQEPLARSLLARLCQSATDVEVVAQLSTGAEALHALRTQETDVIMLEVRLPDMSGFELLRALPVEEAPLPIVVTAYAEHAPTAFEIGAVDFLMKPVRADRFEVALGRVRCRAELAAFPAPSTPVPVQPATGRPRLLAAERERRLYLLDPDKIDYVESYGNYVRIWAGSSSYISRDCIKELALLLATAGFVRVQRSKLVNLRAVSYIERPGHGIFVFTLASGARLESTPTYRAEILRAVYPADAIRRQGTHASSL